MMISQFLLFLSLGVTSQYNVDPHVTRDAPHMRGINFSEPNALLLEQTIVPRRQDGGKGMAGYTELQATHHVANYVRLKLGLPLWYEFGTSGPGKSTQFSLGNLLLGASFGLPFSSSGGGWDFLFAVGVDSRIPTSNKEPNGFIGTATQYSMMPEQTFSFLPYVGFYGERDIVSFQTSLGYDVLKTSPDTMRVLRAQAALSYHQLNPVKLVIEYNFSRIQSPFGVSGEDLNYQQLSPSVQYDYEAWRFAGTADIFLGDLQKNAYAGFGVSVAYRY